MNPDALLPSPRAGRFAIVGDLQRTSAAELWRESNRDERRRILERIASEAPDFLVLLGDLVFRGSSAADWRDFDSVTAPVREAGVPMFPILGNHDYWVRRRPALANYFDRFALLNGRRWYSGTYGPLGLLFLDSNRRFLSSMLWRQQRVWYEEELDRFDQDPAVSGTLVFVHHPPYTNSTLTADEKHVQVFFVPGFHRALKSLAMISGHVHSYERFGRAGKTYLVAGGGGGPRARVATAGRRLRHRDDLFAGPALRHFHFLLGTLTPAGVEIEALGLEKRGSEFTPMDRFRLEWPAPRAAAAP